MSESLDYRIVRQACETAATFLSSARREIDDQFGEGYAKDHPDLMVAFMAAASADARTYAIINHFTGIIEKAADDICAICRGKQSP